MKIKKFFIPMLAMIFAVGMAFATADTAVEDYATKYILVDDTWHTIDVDCGIGQVECVVMFEEDPNLNIYQVFNSRDEDDKAEGNGTLKVIDGPVPSN